MKIQEILENANVVDSSKDGKVFNKVQIYRDQYDYIISLLEEKNEYEGFCDDVVEMDYHAEFIPMIKKAKNKLNGGI